MTHELKCHREPFQALLDGCKRFEIREDDRGFKVGDRLHLREWQPIGPGSVEGYYWGREVEFFVTYISRGSEWGFSYGMVVMSLRLT